MKKHIRWFYPRWLFKHNLVEIYKNERVNVNDVFFYRYINNISHREMDKQVDKAALTKIKRKYALIILTVNLDILNSISRSWAYLVDEATENQRTPFNVIFILGNKGDPLPKDQILVNSNSVIKGRNLLKLINSFLLGSELYLSNVHQCLDNECAKCGLGKHLVKYSFD